MKNRILDHFDGYQSGHYSGAVTELRNYRKITFSAAVKSLRATQSNYRRAHPEPVIAFAKQYKNVPGPSLHPATTKICAHCKRKGHIRETCFVSLETPDGTKWAAKNPEKATKVRMMKEKFRKKKALDNSKELSSDGVWIVSDENILSTTDSQSKEIILDTGASHHIFNNRTLFVSMSPIKNPIQTASGETMSVSGISPVRFRVFDFEKKNRSKVIEVSDVWYLPNCTKNLISGSQFTSQGPRISSNDRDIGVYSSGGKNLATAHLKNSFFYFNTLPDLSDNKSSESFLSQRVNELITEPVNHCFAHVGSKALKQINFSQLHIN
ncbi:hypothetical protein K3495_g4471 [Podosphaera aphanis]|nr:hypothetical protein K3495_g4471 [Podosphaera aphanis]